MRATQNSHSFLNRAVRPKSVSSAMAPAYWAREKTQRRRSWLVVRAAWLLLPFCGLWQPRAGAGEPSRAEVEFFEKDVRPLLVEKCWSCHGDAKRPKGGLRLTSRSSLLQGGDSGAAAIAGDPAASPLIAAIRYNHELKMPPKGKLPDREIDALHTLGCPGSALARDKSRDREVRRGAVSVFAVR